MVNYSDLNLTMPEPWRVKVVDRIQLVSLERRGVALQESSFDVLGLHADDVFIDLLTDSGRGAMSAEQWAVLHMGDDVPTGSQNWNHVEQVVRELTGCPFVIPVHQGRRAEAIYCRAFVRHGDVVLGNLHYDTTRAHILERGGKPVDLVVFEGLDPRDGHPFKGNVDLQRAEQAIRANPGRIRLFILTATATNNGGQPVSMENARAVAAMCRHFGILLLVDAARLPENSFLIREREPGQGGRSAHEISREFLSLADVVAMSARKAALVSIGGFLALRHEADHLACHEWAMLSEGYSTYDGMAGRDLEAMARGLREGLDLNFLAARIRQVRLLHSLLDEAGIPLFHPPGGHSVLVDAGAFLDHLPREEFPAESLAAALYLAGGVRARGHGALASDETSSIPGTPEQLAYPHVRLAIPRRVYTDNHLAYVVSVLRQLWVRRGSIEGLRGKLTVNETWYVPQPWHVTHTDSGASDLMAEIERNSDRPGML
jgi:tryptophanase